MGAWGHKALESDEGLDVVDFIQNYISSKYSNNEPVDLTLSELISSMKEDGFFGQTFADIDFYFDHSAMALTELYFMFKTTGQLKYEDETGNLKKRVKSFAGDRKSFEFLVQYLNNIKREVPDKDGEREIVCLWKESDVYNKWQENLDSLIDGLKAEKKN